LGRYWRIRYWRIIGTRQTLPLDIGEFNRDAVLRNDVVFGSVSANRRHNE
jgi:hypothetical protein